MGTTRHRDPSPVYHGVGWQRRPGDGRARSRRRLPLASVGRRRQVSCRIGVDRPGTAHRGAVLGLGGIWTQGRAPQRSSVSP
jgi:hypothetical protein